MLPYTCHLGYGMCCIGIYICWMLLLPIWLVVADCGCPWRAKGVIAAPLPLNMPQTFPVGLTAMWHACSAASSSLAVGSTTNASSTCTLGPLSDLPCSLSAYPGTARGREQSACMSTQQPLPECVLVQAGTERCLLGTRSFSSSEVWCRARQRRSYLCLTLVGSLPAQEKISALPGRL